MLDPQKILLVEDQEADQFIANRNLRRRWPDVEIVCALDGKQAIDFLESNMDSLPDLILLDINMPRMNGHEFMSAWSKRHSRNIPVVVMLTSSEQSADKERSKEYGFVRDYILKPLNKTTVESLSTALENLDV